MVVETKKTLLALVAQDKIILDPINRVILADQVKVNLELLIEVAAVVVLAVLVQMVQAMSVVLAVRHQQTTTQEQRFRIQVAVAAVEPAVVAQVEQTQETAAVTMLAVLPQLLIVAVAAVVVALRVQRSQAAMAVRVVS